MSDARSQGSERLSGDIRGPENAPSAQEFDFVARLSEFRIAEPVFLRRFWRRIRSRLPPQPTSLPVRGISARSTENAGNPRHFEPEREPETPGKGACGTAKWESSLSANWRFGIDHMGPLPPVPTAVHQLRIKNAVAAKAFGSASITSPAFSGWWRSARSSSTPGARRSTYIEHPDPLVFDLDPGEGVSWEFVVESGSAWSRSSPVPLRPVAWSTRTSMPSTPAYPLGLPAQDGLPRARRVCAR